MKELFQGKNSQLKGDSRSGDDVRMIKVGQLAVKGM